MFINWKSYIGSSAFPTTHCDSPQQQALREAQVSDAAQILEQAYQALLAGQHDDALMKFGWLVMTQPDNWQAHLALAGALRVTHAYQEAMQSYGYALMLNPVHPEPLYQIAVCLEALGELALAREALTLALAMSFENPIYCDVRAHIECKLQQLQASL